MNTRTLHTQLEALTRGSCPEEYEIATLTRFDIPALALLSLAAYGMPTTVETLLEATDEMRLCFDGVFGTPLDNSLIGAWHDGTLIAAIIVVLDPPMEESSGIPHVIDLMVDPDFRRRGIATALVAEVARRCPSWGATSIAVRIDEENPHLPHLYDLFASEAEEER